MNRLFWKFFASFLLAQLLTTAMVVGLIWFKEPPHLRGREFGEPPEIGAMSLPPPVLPRPTGGDSFVGQPPRHAPHFPIRSAIAGALTSLLFAYLLARYFSKPILGLRRGFREIGTGNFDFSVARVLHGRHDELADLGREFDRTAARLKSLIESQRRLLNDVSHEVRSPLARMQLAIDLIERQPEKREELLHRITRESARIDALIAQVLTLARLETTVQWPLDEQVNLHDLIETLIGDAAFEAAEKDCRIVYQPPTTPAQASVRGNTELLHRTVENVLRNAIRFTAPGTAITIRLSDGGHWWEISVCDAGPGVPEDKISRMFQPFERTDSTTHQGYGLGLAIVYQTLKLHGGSVSAANMSATGGLCIHMQLPKTDKATTLSVGRRD